MVRTLTEGQVFAGYRIERLLGAGGMGEVYLARDRDLPRRVALKVLGPGVSHDSQVRARFLREADTVARLSHSNIVAVYARGEEDGKLWMAMQFIDGTDLSAVLSDGPLEPERAAHIVTEVAKALDHAHDGGVLHRDVKPANILLARGDGARVFLADFGIAKVLDHVGEATRTGQLYASLRYAAPEQFDTANTLDRRTDVYALGGTLFHLLTGTPPYPGETAGQLLHGHLNQPVPRPSTRRPGLHPAFDSVIARALAKNPDHRFGTCAEFATAVRHALSGQSVAAPRALATATVSHNFSGTGTATSPDAATTVVVSPSEATWLRVWGRRALWLFGGLSVLIGFTGVALHYTAWERREIVLAASFAPYLMLGALLGMVLLLCARGWRSALVAFGVVVAAVASQLTLFVPDGQATFATEVAVMQSNVYFGRADPVDVVRAVRDNRIDVLTLEELTPEMLAALEAAGLDAELPHRFAEPFGGATGSAIFSRHPLQDGVKLEGFQHNNLRATMIHPTRGPVTVFNFHPVPPNVNFTHWSTELRHIRDLLAATKGPAIVGADFNATFDHYAFRQLLTGRFSDAAELSGSGRLSSWPNGLAMIGIDRVLVAEGQAVDIRSHTIADSDHRAVIARLRF